MTSNREASVKHEPATGVALDREASVKHEPTTGVALDGEASVKHEPATDVGPMVRLLYVFAVLEALGGIGVFMVAKSAIHEILGTLAIGFGENN